MTTTAAQQQLEEHLDSIIAKGAGLDDIMAALEASGALDDTGTAPQADTDDLGRVLLPETSPTSSRHYFNIRDRADGDPTKAQDLAQWALRQYRKALEQRNAAVEAASRQIAMVEAWRQQQTDAADKQLSFFEGVLDQYREDFCPDEKTVKLIGGKLKVTKNCRLISWQEDLAKAWALQQVNVDDLCPRGFSKSAVKSLLTKQGDGSYVLSDTGETVEFVRDVDPPLAETFKVEVD